MMFPTLFEDSVIADVSGSHAGASFAFSLDLEAGTVTW